MLAVDGGVFVYLSYIVYILQYISNVLVQRKSVEIKCTDQLCLINLLCVYNKPHHFHHVSSSQALLHSFPKDGETNVKPFFFSKDVYIKFVWFFIDFFSYKCSPVISLKQIVYSEIQFL